MQVWKVLHAARCKCRTQKSRQQSPSGHHPTILSGYSFTTKACIDNRKKLVKQQYLIYMSPQYGEHRPTIASEIVSLVWGTPGNFNGFGVLSALLHGTLVVGVNQTAALNRGRHLHSAGRPSRWALAHISSLRKSWAVIGNIKILFTISERKFKELEVVVKPYEYYGIFYSIIWVEIKRLAKRCFACASIYSTSTSYHGRI